ncbi:prolactin-2A1-like [Grammomys surdaster]|uniref:prolactin-2A1-like n=1 Tax=Grammomys surdaster TaxID=491861 RepID=UPI00109FB6DD|nr:prolactin-2A1-like [Grammomys surdaster]
MQLSVTHPCYRTLLLLLVSNLLLWENEAVVPLCLVRNGLCFGSLEEMLERAVGLSEEISKQAFQLFTEFDSQYTQSQQLINKNLKKCHTSSLELPKPGSQVMQTHPITLLKLVRKLLNAWEVPLNHLVNNLPSLQNVRPTILSKAREIKAKSAGLLEGVKSIIIQMQNGDTEDQNYPGWSGLASLQSESEDVRLFAYYNMIRCECRDIQRVETALKIVKCLISNEKNC